MIESTTLHGVLVAIAGKGILIIGDAGVGKSSFALELLYQGHQLIADDNIDISITDDTIIGHCPPLVENILHTRELGLIAVSTVFGQPAWQKQHAINYVVQLQTNRVNEPFLSTKDQKYSLLGHQLPLLILTTHSPASLYHRLDCWLKIQATQADVEANFVQRQQEIMA